MRISDWSSDVCSSDLLRIADRRRGDALGNPCLASADLDPDIFRALLLDIAAWRLGALADDGAQAADLGETVRALIAAQAGERGIDAAARDYQDRKSTRLNSSH